MSSQGNESELPIRFAETGQAALDASKTAGQLLREAREAQGLHVAALAVSLKVPVKKLEALEADRFEELPDAVFVRALASSICRNLKIDAAPILQRLPQLNKKVLESTDKHVNVSLRSRADGPTPSVLTHLNRPVVLGVVALLLAALVLMLFPDFMSRNAPKTSDTSSTVIASTGVSNGVSMGNPINVASTPAAAGSDTLTGNTGKTGGGSSLSGETTSLTTLSVTPALSTPAVSSPTLTVSPLATAVVPADSVVVFTATGETWVEVRDAGGKIALQRTLQSGEQAGAVGRMPLTVIVGRANLTQVTVRGKVFDLAPVSSKDAVARFQVK
jgi:cytoskeleton protein RodZ